MKRRRREIREAVNTEIGRLQATEALLVTLKFAADHDQPYDTGRALSAVLALVGQTLDGLDQLEVAL